MQVEQYEIQYKFRWVDGDGCGWQTAYSSLLEEWIKKKWFEILERGTVFPEPLSQLKVVPMSEFPDELDTNAVSIRLVYLKVIEVK